MDNVQISQSRPWILRARCQHSVLFVFHRDYNENGVGQLTIEVGSQDMNWSRSGASAPNPEESLFSHDKGTRVTLDDEFSMGKCSCWSFWSAAARRAAITRWRGESWSDPLASKEKLPAVSALYKGGEEESDDEIDSTTELQDI